MGSLQSRIAHRAARTRSGCNVSGIIERKVAEPPPLEPIGQRFEDLPILILQRRHCKIPISPNVALGVSVIS
jgi:hypothetical protein